jgi:hypothetical protein
VIRFGVHCPLGLQPALPYVICTCVPRVGEARFLIIQIIICIASLLAVAERDPRRYGRNFN